MRYLIIALVLFASCKGQPSMYEPAVIHDTVSVIKIVPSKCDTVFIPAPACARQVDSLKSLIKSKDEKLKKLNFKVTKAKYYLKIVDANPSYLKYIKGWLNNRALAD